MVYAGLAGTIEDMWRIRVVISICLTLCISTVNVSLAAGVFSAGIMPSALPLARAVRPGPGTFLVARRALDGSHFGQTVVYLVEHGDDGSLGLIVNRPSHVGLEQALPDIDAERAAVHALHYGGPVEVSMILMLVRSETAAKGMAYVDDDVYISADRRVLDEMLAAQKPASELRFYLGHSGWAGGQLAGELARGSWHVVAADTDAIFADDAVLLWDRLIERLEPTGIQVDRHPSPPLALAGKPAAR